MHEYALLREHEAPGLSRGLSKMTLSSLQAQAPRVILSGFSPVELYRKDKEKTGLPDLPIKGPVKTAK